MTKEGYRPLPLERPRAVVLVHDLARAAVGRVARAELMPLAATDLLETRT